MVVFIKIALQLCVGVTGSPLGVESANTVLCYIRFLYYICLHSEEIRSDQQVYHRQCEVGVMKHHTMQN